MMSDRETKCSTLLGRLRGKHAFVTGGASGIGAAIVRRFVQEGCKVTFCDVDDTVGQALALELQQWAQEQLLEQQLEQLQEANNNNNNNNDYSCWCRYVHCDVSKEEQVKTVMSHLQELHIVVNNAAVFEFGRIEDVTDEVWERTLGVNVKGYAWVVKHALPLLRRKTCSSTASTSASSSSASIVNLASISSFIAQPAFVPYNTSKGAILQLTRCLAMDLAADNIRVNAVCPGGIDTPATSRHASSQHKTLEEVTQELSEGYHLIPRMGRPEEVANAVLFLASDEASFITGHPLMVDGGWSVR